MSERKLAVFCVRFIYCIHIILNSFIFSKDWTRLKTKTQQLGACKAKCHLLHLNVMKMNRILMVFVQAKADPVVLSADKLDKSRPSFLATFNWAMAAFRNE